MTPEASQADAARCTVHPALSASRTCSRCGRFCCAVCLPPAADDGLCSSCLERFQTSQPLEWASSATPRAFFLTLGAMIAKPGASLGSTRYAGGTVRSLLFALLTLLGPGLPLLGILLVARAQTTGGRPPTIAELTIAVGLMWLGSFAIASLLWPLAQWGALALVGTPSPRLGAQLRLNAYALTPFAVVGWLPGIGWVIAAIWTSGLIVIGSSRAQRASTPEAVFAVISAPIVLALLALALRVDRYLMLL